ncbi:hypothetical protein CXF79_06325 [Colwellia sp. Bg11-28]|nr:hypothetical protein CXF79_06325 [Colwellia sp. Bg11-28]
MKYKKIKIDSLLLMLIKENLSNGFAIISIRDEYLKRSINPKCSKETRKYIYRQILKLIHLGILIKVGDKYSQKAIYIPSSTFDKAEFSSINSIEKAHYVKIEQPSLYKLENILKEYKVGMLSAIGESEEYIRLSNQFPEINLILKEKHQAARDKSYNFLGKIIAIKDMISIRNQMKIS